MQQRRFQHAQGSLAATHVHMGGELTANQRECFPNLLAHTLEANTK
jgi:hypothetical protein